MVTEMLQNQHLNCICNKAKIFLVLQLSHASFSHFYKKNVRPFISYGKQVQRHLTTDHPTYHSYDNLTTTFILQNNHKLMLSSNYISLFWATMYRNS